MTYLHNRKQFVEINVKSSDLCEVRYGVPFQPIKSEDHVVKFVHVTESECLGMTVNNRLSWCSQAKNVSSNLNKKVKQLKRMKSLPSKVLETIYFRGILPRSTYGIAVWGSCSPALIHRVHRRAAQIIHKIPRTCPDSEILKSAKWKSVAYMYKRRVSSLCMRHTMKDLLTSSIN